MRAVFRSLSGSQWWTIEQP